MNETEQKQANQAAVLVVAALIFSRSVQGVPPAGFAEESRHAFEAAELFVEEAKRRGNDLATIASLGIVG